jgi:Holliday junction resolvasome RuvABC endonuclease subunit
MVPGIPAPWVWGIDSGRARMGIGFVNVETGQFAAEAVELGGNAYPHLHPLAGIYNTMMLKAIFWHDVFRPCTIAAEYPTGRFHIDKMHQAYGAIIAGVSQGSHMKPWQINVTEWKGTVIGAPHAKKEETNARLKSWGERIQADDCEDFEQLVGLAVAVHAAIEWTGFDPSCLIPLSKENPF